MLTLEELYLFKRELKRLKTERNILSIQIDQKRFLDEQIELLQTVVSNYTNDN
ncbi:hypothetical protein [Bacillus sp. JCM 19041]|uniref:hypothetical protein n=1 Tax=Bacillus sp. JCM 19041 TaxID=1460637 RepID=UPI000AA5BC20